MTPRVASRFLSASVLALVASLTLSPLALAADLRPASITAEELQQRLLHFNEDIRAWQIVYESSRELVSDGQQPSYLHREVAAKAPDLFFHWNSHGTERVDWLEDPHQQRLTLSSTMAVSERPFHRTFHPRAWSPDAPLPGSSPGEFLFLALGWWPFDKRTPPTSEGGAPAVLPAIARSPNYGLRPQQELVRNRWCHVLEYPGRDKLWLDSDRNCLIMQRDIYDSKSGALVERIESSGHRELHGGIWVPMQFRNILFDPSASIPQSGNPAPVSDGVLRIIDIRINDQVSDDLFRFDPLPGSLEMGDRGVVARETAGCDDYINHVANWLQRHYAFSPAAVTNSGSFLECVLEYCILCFASLLIGVHCYGRWRAPSVLHSPAPAEDV